MNKVAFIILNSLICFLLATSKYYTTLLVSELIALVAGVLAALILWDRAVAMQMCEVFDPLGAALKFSATFFLVVLVLLMVGVDIKVVAPLTTYILSMMASQYVLFWNAKRRFHHEDPTGAKDRQ